MSLFVRKLDFFYEVLENQIKNKNSVSLVSQ